MMDQLSRDIDYGTFWSNLQTTLLVSHIVAFILFIKSTALYSLSKSSLCHVFEYSMNIFEAVYLKGEPLLFTSTVTRDLYIRYFA